jgi:hypothetical protein
MGRFESTLAMGVGPVKAPFTWPKSSLSNRDSLRAAQLQVMKGPFFLGPKA